MSWEQAETERQLANVVRLGTIAALDPAAARVKVNAAGLTTDWLPFTTSRAGADRTWHPPEVGEQVVLVAPHGDLGQAVVVGSVYQAAHPAPASSADTPRTEWSDGAFVQYDRAAHAYTLSVPAGGSITLKVGAVSLVISDSGIKWTAPALDVDAATSNFSGSVTAQGDVTGGGVSLDGHVHTGVKAGGDKTGGPV